MVVPLYFSFLFYLYLCYMKLKVKLVYDTVNDLLSKNNGVTLSPDEFNRYAELASNALQDEYRGANTAQRSTMGRNRTLDSRLLRHVVSDHTLSTNGGGYAPLPDDWVQTLTLRTPDYSPVRPVDEDRITVVFQDPYSSLNPRMTVGDIVAEPIDIHHLAKNKAERRDKVHELLSLVGLSSEQATRYAHEFSGGQRQRIGIARALASNPEFIVCDEPVSALDVSIQAQVINMLEELQQKLKLTYLFIAHDLSVVKHISNRIAVMYLGHIVELADAGELYRRPLHPYTQSLLSAVPQPDPTRARAQRRIILSGDVPSPLKIPSGCPFRTRCPKATKECAQALPPLEDHGNGHQVRCIHVDG